MCACVRMCACVWLCACVVVCACVWLCVFVVRLSRGFGALWLCTCSTACAMPLCGRAVNRHITRSFLGPAFPAAVIGFWRAASVAYAELEGTLNELVRPWELIMCQHCFCSACCVCCACFGAVSWSGPLSSSAKLGMTLVVQLLLQCDQI